ncbi:type II secretion system F family protein [Celeribacter indicus]|uniref:Type II secretion system protein n=1 Tax=Celeribacter indicus TaxID=1208324 RepID=A0A0B5E614_9RHOB|nr:type II secretion system F family protein [Celeribacter indicus]AJE48840.1 type II secretion system protein [Celeribacter indicus]SDW38815.1 tight adherence protein C [Celeribacter indicus]
MSDLPLPLIAMVIAGLALAAQIAGFGLIDRRTRTARLARLVTRKRAGEGRNRPVSLVVRVRRWIAEISRTLFERVSIMSGGEADASAALLRAAGYRSRDAVFVHAFLKLVLPLSGCLLTAVWRFVEGDLASLRGLIWVCGVALAASKLPDIYLRWRRDRRFEQVTRAFPDMLELLVVACDAGLGSGAALARVARDLQLVCPPLAQDIQQLVIELSILPEREQAWRNLEDRIPLPEIRIFSNALRQAERYGTPLTRALRTLMQEERARRLLRIEEKAGRLPALMTIPLILFIMPALLVVLVGPAALSILDNIMNGGG